MQLAQMRTTRYTLSLFNVSCLILQMIRLEFIIMYLLMIQIIIQFSLMMCILIASRMRTLRLYFLKGHQSLWHRFNVSLIRICTG